MSKFLVVKRISLAHLGPGWEECYISFTPLNFNDNAALQEVRKTFKGVDMEKIADDDAVSTTATEKTLELLKNKFIEGKGYTADGVIALVADDISELPITAVKEFITSLTVQEDPLTDPKG